VARAGAGILEAYYWGCSAFIVNKKAPGGKKDMADLEAVGKDRWKFHGKRLEVFAISPPEFIGRHGLIAIHPILSPVENPCK
jgi:hypothetical protein